VEAALTYVDFRDLLPLEDSRALAKAADEFRDAMLATASTAVAALGLAEFERQPGISTRPESALSRKRAGKLARRCVRGPTTLAEPVFNRLIGDGTMKRQQTGG